jgi:hypothetical protein
MIDSLVVASAQQKQDISSLQNHMREQHARLNALSRALASAGANADQTAATVRSALNQRTVLLVILALALSAVA